MNQPLLQWSCRSEEDTMRAGRELAACLGAGDLVSLQGDLGAGKTVFVRGIASGLGLPAEQIISPTFVLAVQYEGDPGLLHADLYRLDAGTGLEDLGIEEALDGGWVVAVEWGERLPRFLQRYAWQVRLRLTPDSSIREITALAPAPTP